MDVVASIQGRLGSTRLPGKVLYHLGNRRVLQWVVDRTVDSSAIDRTVVAVGDQPENEALQEYCRRNEIRYLTGPETNLLARHLFCSTSSTSFRPGPSASSVSRIADTIRSSSSGSSANWWSGPSIDLSSVMCFSTTLAPSATAALGAVTGSSV